MPSYLPYAERSPSSQYQDLLRNIRDHGEEVQTKQGEKALTVMGHCMRFPLDNGAPVITERSIKGFVPKAIGEICAFINGARTLDEFAEFGCDWWGPWASEDKCLSRNLEIGDLGPGSYGHAFRHFTTDETPGVEGFDQMPNIIRKLKDLPEDRTALLSPWIAPFNHREKGIKSRNTIAPCHGWLHFRVLNGNLHLIHNQRSGDTPIGVPSNMVQYAAVGLMVEHLTGYQFVQYVHWIQDAHIYEGALPAVDELLTREPKRLPTLTLNDEGRGVEDIHDFRGHHFEISDYNPHPAMRGIPVLT